MSEKKTTAVEPTEYEKGWKAAAESFREKLREAMRKIKQESPACWPSDLMIHEEHVDEVLAKLLGSIE